MSKKTFFDDVSNFHRKFKLYDTIKEPSVLSDRAWAVRQGHLREELMEIFDARFNGNVEDFFDGLIDLVYVALGTAVIANLPFNEGWTRVHAANMKKIRATKKRQTRRRTTFDVVKPEGWKKPELKSLLKRQTCKK